MKKKMVSILTAAFCVSALLAGCGFADTAKTSASSAGAASSSTDGTTTFTVGFDAEYPPYGYMDDETGDYTGFDLELAEAVCEIYGWKLVKTPINWDAKDTELNSGAIDCIWNGFTMNGREDQYTFSVPYVDNSQVFVVAEDSGITSKEDLAGKVVGVQKDSSALAALQGDEKALADTFADLPQYADYNTGFIFLRGRTDLPLCRLAAQNNADRTGRDPDLLRDFLDRNHALPHLFLISGLLYPFPCILTSQKSLSHLKPAVFVHSVYFSFFFLAVSTKLHFFSYKLRFFLDISKSLYYTQYDDLVKRCTYVWR